MRSQGSLRRARSPQQRQARCNFDSAGRALPELRDALHTRARYDGLSYPCACRLDWTGCCDDWRIVGSELQRDPGLSNRRSSLGRRCWRWCAQDRRAFHSQRSVSTRQSRRGWDAPSRGWRAITRADGVHLASCSSSIRSCRDTGRDAAGSCVLVFCWHFASSELLGKDEVGGATESESRLLRFSFRSPSSRSRRLQVASEALEAFAVPVTSRTPD